MRHYVELLCVYSHSKEMIVIDLTGIGNTVGTVPYIIMITIIIIILLDPVCG